MHKTSRLVFLTTILIFPAIFAFGSVTLKHSDNIGLLSASDSQLSYFPRLYLGGYTGSEALGQADVLAPIFLRNNLNLFVYGQGRYSYAKEDWAKDPWTGSLGLGYRQLVANTAVLGAHVLSDYTQTTTNHDLWVLSPGIEVLSRTWDFHANGYFPMSEHDWKTEGWADDFGDYSHIYFQGHNQYNAWYIYHQEAGIGTDAELGRKLFTYNNILVKGFVDGYYFNMKHNEDLYGAGARVTIEPNTYLEFSLDDTYDNYAHNTFMFGIEVSLYDLFQKDKVLNDQDLHRRLFDRIDRNFAELGSGSGTRITGGPIDEEEKSNGANGKPPEPEIVWFGHNTPEKENVWFFNGAGLTTTASNDTTLTYEDGTYEHPFTASDFNQQTLEDIYNLTKNNYSNAYLYFNPGTYHTYDANGQYTRVELFPGESIWGRIGNQKGFQEPATGSNRPKFIGAFKLDGNTGLDSIILENDFANTSIGLGILIDQAGNVNINNIKLGTTNDSNTAYRNGIKIDNNGSNVTLNNSEINAHSTTAPTAKGIDVVRGTLNIGDNNNLVVVGDVVYDVYTKIQNGDVGTININGSNNVFSSNGYHSYGFYIYAIDVDSVVTLNINGGNNTFTSTASQFAYWIGILVEDSGAATINLDSSGNVFNVNGNDLAYGIHASTHSSGLITINLEKGDNTFNIKANILAAYGIYIPSSGTTLNFDNKTQNIFDIDADTEAYGVFLNSSVVVYIDGELTAAAIDLVPINEYNRLGGGGYMIDWGVGNRVSWT